MHVLPLSPAQARTSHSLKDLRPARREVIQWNTEIGGSVRLLGRSAGQRRQTCRRSRFNPTPSTATLRPVRSPASPRNARPIYQSVLEHNPACQSCQYVVVCTFAGTQSQGLDYNWCLRCKNEDASIPGQLAEIWPQPVPTAPWVSRAGTAGDLGERGLGGLCTSVPRYRIPHQPSP
jgi:hypothetical protein